VIFFGAWWRRAFGFGFDAFVQRFGDDVPVMQERVLLGPMNAPSARFGLIFLEHAGDDVFSIVRSMVNFQLASSRTATLSALRR
jgi:hypothetical protein